MRIDREAFFELRTSCTRGHPYKLFKHHCQVKLLCQKSHKCMEWFASRSHRF